MAPEQHQPLSVAPLSALDVPVVEYIQAAAQAGFSAVGLRANRVSQSDPAFPLDVSSTHFSDVTAALNDTGLEVLDLEVFTVTPQVERRDWMPLMEVGAELGAQYLNVVGAHPSFGPFEEVVAELTVDAREHGLKPVLEPVAYRDLNNFNRAIDIARNAGCAVEMDILHFLRTGADLDTVRANRDVFPILQLCDAPRSLADHGDLLRDVAVKTGEGDLAVAESRGLRLLPGDGAGPIREIISVLGPSTRVSVEIPNVAVRGDRSAGQYLALLHKAAQNYLAIGQ